MKASSPVPTAVLCLLPMGACTPPAEPAPGEPPAAAPVLASTPAEPEIPGQTQPASEPSTPDPPPTAPSQVQALFDRGRCGQGAKGVTPIACRTSEGWIKDPQICLASIPAGAIVTAADGTTATLGPAIPPEEDDEPCRTLAGDTRTIWSLSTPFPAAPCTLSRGSDRDAPEVKLPASDLDPYPALLAPHLVAGRTALIDGVMPEQWLRADLDGDGAMDLLATVELMMDCWARVVRMGPADAGPFRLVHLSSAGCMATPEDAVQEPLFLLEQCYDLDGNGRPELVIASGPETMYGEGMVEFADGNLTPVGVPRYFGD